MQRNHRHAHKSSHPTVGASIHIWSHPYLANAVVQPKEKSKRYYQLM